MTVEILGGIVDLHTHVFPRRMFEAVWEYFETRDWPVHREYVEDMAATLTAHGVTRAVGLSYPHKPGVARSLNRFMMEVGERVPLFRPFASVHPEDDDLRETIDEALASPHIHGFKFQPLVQRFDVNDPRLDALYEPCRERRIPITMHIGSGPVANEFVGVPHFTKLMRRFPDLRICVPHMGAPEFADFLALLDDCPNMFLDTTMVNTRTTLFENTWRGDGERLARNADRVCFGSDWPNVPYSYQEAIDSVRRYPFAEEHLPLVYRENALRFLDPAAPARLWSSS